MANRLWPAGISPSGKGLRIKIFEKGKCVYSETCPGDPYNKSHIAATKRRRDELVSRKNLGLSLTGDVQTEGSAALFAEVAQDYLNTLDVKDSVSIEYERAINRYWMPPFQSRLIAEINSAHIRQVLANHRITAKTKKNILTPLKGIFRHAGIDPTPADGVKPKRDQKAPIKRYSPDERENLLSHLEGTNKVFFAILFGCGLRPSEALALRYDRWDGERLTIDKVIVRRELRESTKTNVRRRVYVPKWVRPLINELPTRFAKGFLFVNQFGRHHKTTKVFDKAWRAAHKASGVEYRHPYTCRHTRAAELLSVGADPARAAAQLGHSLQMFMQVYSEFMEEFSGLDDSIFEGATTDKKLTRKGKGEPEGA